jgi:hypothetical protein
MLLLNPKLLHLLLHLHLQQRQHLSLKRHTPPLGRRSSDSGLNNGSSTTSNSKLLGRQLRNDQVNAMIRQTLNGSKGR